MGLHSCFLMFEFETYLRYGLVKMLRIIAFIISMSVQFMYGVLLIDWLVQLYDTSQSDEEKWDFVSVFQSMFIAYNLIMNLTTIPINYGIIIKELTLPIIQFASPNAGHVDDDISINTDDIELRFIDFINPGNYINLVFYRIFGYPI